MPGILQRQCWRSFISCSLLCVPWKHAVMYGCLIACKPEVAQTFPPSLSHRERCPGPPAEQVVGYSSPIRGSTTGVTVILHKDEEGKSRDKPTRSHGACTFLVSYALFTGQLSIFILRLRLQATIVNCTVFPLQRQKSSVVCPKINK